MSNNSLQNLFAGLKPMEQEILRKALQLHLDTKNDDLTDQKKLSELKDIVLKEI